jgi:hypothetical protein
MNIQLKKNFILAKGTPLANLPIKNCTICKINHDHEVSIPLSQKAKINLENKTHLGKRNK